MANYTFTNLLKLLNTTPYEKVQKECKKEFKRRGYKLIWDSYVNEWKVIG